jgi:hypothetical protein
MERAVGIEGARSIGVHLPLECGGERRDGCHQRSAKKGVSAVIFNCLPPAGGPSSVGVSDGHSHFRDGHSSENGVKLQPFGDFISANTPQIQQTLSGCVGVRLEAPVQ